MSNIKWGTVDIGLKGALTLSVGAGEVSYRVRAEYKATDGSVCRQYLKSLAVSLGCDDVRVIRIPRSLGVRIYADAGKQNLEVDGVSYGSVAVRSLSVESVFGNGYGTFIIEFVGSV